MERNHYLEIYKAAHYNAVQLLKEAELLFRHRHFARAYVLAFTSLEEISKSQFAADVFTDLEKPLDFDRFYKDHKKKIKRMGWSHADANLNFYNVKWVGPDRDDIEIIRPQKPSFKKRQNPLLKKDKTLFM